MDQALRFKAMYSRLGFTVADVARFLQVTPRTVHAWISGRVRIPYAAYKLLRLQLHYELPGDAWSGWHLSAGRLYTPEGHELSPHDFTWWGLLCRKAALFSTLYSKAASVAGTTAAGALGMRSVPGAPGVVRPDRLVGRPAPPAGPNSFLEHFRKRKEENGFKQPFPALEVIAENHDVKKEVCMAKSRPQRKRSRQLGGGGGGAGGRAFRVEVAKIAQEEASKLKKQGKWKPVGSPLLQGLLGPSKADVAALAAREWDKVTNGAGVVLVDGKPVDAKGGDSI